MIDNRPLWKKPWATTLLVLIAGGIGAWLAMDRPLPEAWLERWTDQSGRPRIEVPEIFQRRAEDRLFCAESVDSGVCSCISSNGERPQIDDAECRQRARSAATDVQDQDDDNR